MGRKRGKSSAKGVQPVSSIPASSGKTSDVVVAEWEAWKSKGNADFERGAYQNAILHYNMAVECLLRESSSDKKTMDLAKLCGNRSAAYYQLSAPDNDREVLKKALEEGKKAVEYDSSYEKGYFRCAAALSKLGQKSQAVEYLGQILNFYRARGADYSSDKFLIECLVDSKYSSATKRLSPNWDKVKFKDSCVVVDPSGAGDYSCVSQCFTLSFTKLSVLLKPGKYNITNVLMLDGGKEIDIIGDITRDQEPSEVVLCTSGDTFYHMFGSFHNAKLMLENISIRQESRHPERHGLFIANGGNVIMTNCLGYSRCSSLIAVDCNSHLVLSKTTIDKACAAVIVTGGSFAIIDHCLIKNCARIGVEIRGAGFAVVTNTEISNCGSQGLTGHAGALGYALYRCVFYGNCGKLPDQCSVFAAAGISRIDECQITCCGVSGGGVMVQEGGICEISNTRIAGGRTGFGFSTKGSASISNCQIANVHMGVTVILNQPATIVMENNTIVAKRAEILITDDDVAPTMIGEVKHTIVVQEVNLNSALMKKELKRQNKLCNKDHHKPETSWPDPRSVAMPGTIRICVPCGLSQRGGGRRYLKCSACRLSWYCSKECQLKDWPMHKIMCAKIQEIWKRDRQQFYETSSTDTGQLDSSSTSSSA